MIEKIKIELLGKNLASMIAYMFNKTNEIIDEVNRIFNKTNEIIDSVNAINSNDCNKNCCNSNLSEDNGINKRCICNQTYVDCLNTNNCNNCDKKNCSNYRLEKDNHIEEQCQTDNSKAIIIYDCFDCLHAINYPKINEFGFAESKTFCTTKGEIVCLPWACDKFVKRIYEKEEIKPHGTCKHCKFNKNNICAGQNVMFELTYMYQKPSIIIEDDFYCKNFKTKEKDNG